MYFDYMENVSEVEEDFFTALIHLHSTDINSAENLREILDSLISKKYGESKTLAARRICHDSSFSSLSEKYINSCTNGRHQTIKRYSCRSRNESTKMKCLNIAEFPLQKIKTHDPSSSTAIITTNIDQKMINILDTVDRMEIPTISIPDEGSGANDDALCKICTGPRLGPLILMECQECQDAYHPLCHQPPVLDLDIYDPRLVWHCAKCVDELSEAAAITVAAAAATAAASEFQDDKFHSENFGISKNQEEQVILVKDEGEIFGINHSNNEYLNYFRRTKSRINSNPGTPISDQFQLRNRTSIGIRRSAKRQTKTMEQKFSNNRNGSLKNGTSLAFSSTISTSGVNLRKRVGSKLTMTRGITAAK